MATSYRFCITSDTGPRGCRRGHGRRYQEGLESTAGTVLDLSAGGMRVITRRRPPARDIQIALISEDGELCLDARCAWVKRVGVARFEVGYEFLAVDQAARDHLTRISSAHRKTLGKVA